MSSDNWNTSAEQERIINRKKRMEQKRKEREKDDPAAFGWEKTDEGDYQCVYEKCGCEREYATLAGVIEHLNNLHEPGQSSLEDW